MQVVKCPQLGGRLITSVRGLNSVRWKDQRSNL